jgi:hypothetical protein
MRTIAQTIKNILLMACLVLGSGQALFSQGNDSIRGKGLFAGISLGPTQTQVLNEGTSAVSDIVSGNGNSFSGVAEVGYFFSKYIGLSSGIGFSSYKANVTLADWQSNFNATDSENQNFEMRASGTNISEDQKLSYLNIPVYLNLRLPIKGKIGLFLQTGVNLAFLTGKDYTSNGIFTYKGYYSKYNVVLENLPQYGFPTNKATTAQGSLGVKSFTVFAVASAGVDYFVAEKYQIALAATYNKSVSDILANPASTQYQLSPAADQINSFMGGSSKVTAQSIGISVSLRYYFNH